MNKVKGISEAAKMNKGPIEGVLAIGPMIDGDDDVTATAALAGLSLQLRLRHFGDEAGE